MSEPKIDWSKNPHGGLDNDATWLKAENSTLRARIKELCQSLAMADRSEAYKRYQDQITIQATHITELEAEVARLKKANNDSLWCGQKDESRIAELEAEVARLGEIITKTNTHIAYRLDIERQTATEAALRYGVDHLWEFSYADTHQDNVTKREDWVKTGLKALLGEKPDA